MQDKSLLTNVDIDVKKQNIIDVSMQDKYLEVRFLLLFVL